MPRGRPATDDIFTPREWQVLLHVRHGLTNIEIANQLGVSLAGAKYHVSEILSKLGVKSRKDAAVWHPRSIPDPGSFDSMNRAYLEQQLQNKMAVAEPIINIFDGEDRYICELPGCRFAVVADNPRGVERMRGERAILRALADSTFQRVPQVLTVSDDDTVELRAGVPGRSRIPDLVERLRVEDVGRKVIRQIATLLVELHSALSPEVAIDLTKDIEMWPPSSTWVKERLPHVLSDQGLISELNGVLDYYDRIEIRKCVLCQGDPTFQNMAFSEELNINGIFDFYTATACEPEWDMRYLWFEDTAQAAELRDLGIATYAELSGYQPDRERVLLYNAISAIAYLAFRKGIDANTLWCGRTLAGDLAWTRAALDKLG
jgi:DNA-binding CsgD family transcriptional regulator/aminoglycoside phosphotransferase (APT) family kinase protein